MNEKELDELVSNHKKGIENLQTKMQKMQKELDMFLVLKKIFAQNGDDSKVKELQKENKQLKKYSQELTSLNNSLKDDKLQLTTQLENEISKNAKLKEKNLRLEKELSKNPLQKIDNLYNKLNETTKDGIKNILKNKNELTLFSSATLNIEPLWEYLKYLRNEHKDKEFEILNEIFLIVFKTYINVTNITYQNINIGDEFDGEFHTRDNRSEGYDDDIKEIILCGLVEDDKIIKKSIVRV